MERKGESRPQRKLEKGESGTEKLEVLSDQVVLFMQKKGKTKLMADTQSPNRHRGEEGTHTHRQIWGEGRTHSRTDSQARRLQQTRRVKTHPHPEQDSRTRQGGRVFQPPLLFPLHTSCPGPEA